MDHRNITTINRLQARLVGVTAAAQCSRSPAQTIGWAHETATDAPPPSIHADPIDPLGPVRGPLPRLRPVIRPPARTGFRIGEIDRGNRLPGNHVGRV